MQLTLQAAFTLCLLLSGACSLPVVEDGHLQTYAEDRQVLQSYDSFQWAGPMDQEERLRDQSVYRLVAKELQARGLVEQQELRATTLLVEIDLTHQLDEEVIPEQQTVQARYQPGPLYPSTVCDAQGRSYTRWSRSSGYWVHVPVTIPQHTVRRYQLAAQIELQSPQGSALWQSELQSQSRHADLNRRLEAWIPEMFRAFPDATVGNGAREVTLGSAGENPDD